MFQIRWHGRGGQGAVTAAKIFGLAISYENKYAQCFPAFGVERRGAPVLAFTKIDTIPILDRSQVYTPDLIVVLDNQLVETIDVTDGLKNGGTIIINATRIPDKLSKLPYKIVNVDATKIAIELMGKAIVNTPMLGAVCAVTDYVSFESLEKAIFESFPESLVHINKKAARVAFEEVASLKGVGKV